MQVVRSSALTAANRGVMVFDGATLGSGKRQLQLTEALTKGSVTLGTSRGLRCSVWDDCTHIKLHMDLDNNNMFSSCCSHQGLRPAPPRQQTGPPLPWCPSRPPCGQLRTAGRKAAQPDPTAAAGRAEEPGMPPLLPPRQEHCLSAASTSSSASTLMTMPSCAVCCTGMMEEKKEEVAVAAAARPGAWRPLPPSATTWAACLRGISNRWRLVADSPPRQCSCCRSVAGADPTSGMLQQFRAAVGGRCAGGAWLTWFAWTRIHPLRPCHLTSKCVRCSAAVLRDVRAPILVGWLSGATHAGTGHARS